MKLISLLTAIIAYVLISCINPISSAQSVEETQDLSVTINSEAVILKDRFSPPEGFSRWVSLDDSFGSYLQNLPLKDGQAQVSYYDGSIKDKANVYCAVVDLAIGNRDLHQCADAVMRLKAEHLFEQGKYEDIHFNFTNGFRADYSTWRDGNRIRVNGNQVSWVSTQKESTSAESFWKYLEMVFSYAGTASLAKELNSTSISELSIGDVFIQGGFPGHAVIVVDVCSHLETGEKLFMLAQSYMPAQEIQILQNPKNQALSPWYSSDFGEVLPTPEWTFNASDLKSF